VDIEEVAAQCAELPGVVAVTLGGSRARGEERPDSDWDFVLYYRGTIAADDVRALGYRGEVFAPGDWGSIVNGGAWLDIDGTKVDLIYRDLDEVLHWTDEAIHGRFEVRREVGYVAGITTYVLAGELAIAKVLHGTLPRPEFTDALADQASSWWFHIADMALRVAAGHAIRSDSVATCANVKVAALASAQGRLAARRWVLGAGC
jgi:Nucleotidyltransferase domain